ncbi:MAG TPA: helix-turn-helix domain-containing protein [Capsulimonadaceae bacterium]|nr:helix-turn-helix domain-containing protein [Capsulimonadaceae bacterium]
MYKHRHVLLTTEQRHALERIVRSGNARARTQTKARILLLTDRSQGGRRKDREIIEALGTSICTIVRTRQAFCEEGLDAALQDKPRSGKPPKLTGDVEAKLTMIACSAPPEGRARWTLRLLAEKMVELEYVDSITPVAIHKHLKKTNSSRGS